MGFDESNTSREIRELALAAEKRIRPHIRRTPMEPAADLSRENEGRVYLKMESMQHTGSFKVRGALNRLLAMDESELRAGVITASSGNHGLATAFGMNRLGIDGTIYLPENASPLKVSMLKDLGAAIRFHGADCDRTEAFARQQAEKTGKIYISPYNDTYVIGGQGTIGLEILDRLPHVDCILASVGGGGLITGIAGAVKAVRPETTVIGCLPENSPAMAVSVQSGRILDVPMQETLSDGTAGGIEPGAITFDACTRLVDRWQLVSENDIRRAMVLVFERHRLVIEGAAAVAVAGFLKLAPRLTGKTTVIVTCGRNIDMGVFRTVVCPKAVL
ncbi:serine/threonine dehydratase [Desulfosarcina widdelii]|uniref:Serine/threonine dehydratase n=1 Tax=Desulfosarcina widdelii TaxID=947919 RepID=A0A5K7ZH96_9BACT|nr:threonine/serine dehydratase [Desulfosarcina widdelii]BBO75467.1 serine/threonine dehydratase [Desulfosarcina widdelii]